MLPGAELGPLAGLLVEACLLLIYIHRKSSEQVCFLGPELGPLAGLLVGPQTGSWLLEEVHICSSRTRHTDRCAGLFGRMHLVASGRASNKPSAPCLDCSTSSAPSRLRCPPAMQQLRRQSSLACHLPR